MRKQTKIAALVSAAAVLAIGASMTSLADWVAVGSEWEWHDRYGDPVTNEWHTSTANGQTGYFYLGDDGLMARDQIVEYNGDYYYVNADGLKLVDQWISFPNDEGLEINGNTPATLYLYCQSGTGKIVRGTDKTLKVANGSTDTAKFFFDDDGYMISGWYTTGDKTYYLNDEDQGWSASGWTYMEPPTETENPYEEGMVWYYFDGNGMKTGGPHYLAYSAENSKKYYFMFSSEGVLQEDTWVETTSTVTTASEATASVTTHAYYADGGARMTGWQNVGKIVDDAADGWYYLDAKGVAFNDGAKDAATIGTAAAWDANAGAFKAGVNGYAARVIKGKTYLFDQYGHMVTGIYKLTDVTRVGSATNLGVDGAKIYYFGGNGDMSQNRKEQVTNDYDQTYYYFLDTNGSAAVNRIASGVLYGSDGTRVNAQDASWQVVSFNDAITSDKSVKIGTETVNSLEAGTEMVVNATGRVKESGTVTIEGVKYYIKSGKKNAGTEYHATGAAEGLPYAVVGYEFVN